MYELSNNVPILFVLGNKNNSAETTSPMAIIVPQFSNFAAAIPSGAEILPYALNKYSAVNNPAMTQADMLLIFVVSIFLIYSFVCDPSQ